MPIFDGDNLEITLDTDPSGTLTIDAQTDLYEPWKDWLLLNPLNRRYPFAFRTIGGDDLTAGIQAGAYFFLQNDVGWRIRFPEQDMEYILVGNLALEDASLESFTSSTGSFKNVLLGLQPITQNVDLILTQSQKADYEGAVWIDTISGTTGTTYPSGTSFQPVNNLADALTIDTALGFHRFNLIGQITLSQAFNYYTFEGRSAVAEVIINGQDISASNFVGVGLSGTCPTMSERAVLSNGRVSPAGLLNFRGVLANTILAGNVSMQAGDHTLANVASDIPGTMRPYIDLQGNNINLSVRGYLGGLELRNCSNALTDISVDFYAGALRILNTCTDGTIVVRGVADLDDQSAGTNVVKIGLIDSDDLKLAKQMLAGRAVVSGDDLTVTVYDEDDVTVLQTFTISADGRIRTPT